MKGHLKDLVIDRLESMHDRLGTAGFAIAVIALIAALAGGAYAATGGLTPKQKKEVTKIAKKYAGKPGPAGPAGQNGANGKDGANGANGANGTDGKSVTLNSFTQEDEELGNPPGEPCELQGGLEVGVEGSGTPKTVCNGAQGEPGEEGEPWTAGGTLPPNATETGAWAKPEEGSKDAFVPITFNVPLESGLPESNVHIVEEGVAPPEACENPAHPGSASVSNPEAKSGHLCVYEGWSPVSTVVYVLKLNFNPTAEPPVVEFGASVAGAIIGVNGNSETFAPAIGSYAVTG